MYIKYFQLTNRIAITSKQQIKSLKLIFSPYHKEINTIIFCAVTLCAIANLFCSKPGGKSNLEPLIPFSVSPSGSLLILVNHTTFWLYMVVKK